MKTVVVNGASPVVRGQLGFVDPATMAAVDHSYSAEESAEVMEHLRSLGYVE